MARPKPEQSDAVGQDSFLDVTTNVVGIMIILVMITGIRAKQAPLGDVKPSADSPTLTTAAAPQSELTALRKQQSSAEQELDTLKTTVSKLASEHSLVENDINDLAKQGQRLQSQQITTRSLQSRLTTLLADGQVELQDLRGKLQGTAQQEFDLQRSLLETQVALNDVLQSAEKTAAVPLKNVEVAAYVTPLGKVVDGDEVHFQLRGGRVSYVPMEELIELAKRELKPEIDGAQNITQLQEVTEQEFRAGPRRGFEMRFALDVQLDREKSRVRVGMRKFEIFPTQSDLGEPLERALQPNSQFQADVREFSPRKATLTLWTYPDSFALYRGLQTALQQQGYQVAGRLLPNDVPIGGSPNGSKSLAQ